MKKYMVNYALNNDDTGIITFQMIAMSEFGERAEFDEEEAKQYIEFLHSRKIPKFEDRLIIGTNDIGLSYSEWDNFVEENRKAWEDIKLNK